MDRAHRRARRRPGRLHRYVSFAQSIDTEAQKMKRLPDALAPLMEQNQWLIWRFRHGKKVPYQSNRPAIHASPTDPNTWSSYREALRAAPRVGGGIGFVLRGAAIGALDLDDCRHPLTGKLDDWACNLITRASAYCEVTPSKCGLRVIGTATGGPVHRHVKMPTGKVEVYRDAERYIVVTGNQLGNCKRLPNLDGLIDELAPKRVSNGAVAMRRSGGPHDWREVLNRYGRRSLRLMVTNPVMVGYRSDVICRIALELYDRGATVDEVACVIGASRAWQSKHGGGRRRPEQEAISLANYWQRGRT
jgi:hypothetical protein